MVVSKKLLKLLAIFLYAFYIVLGILLLALGIHLCTISKHIEWTTALIFYLSLEAVLTPCYGIYAAFKENARLLLHCSAMIVTSILLKFIILLLLRISSITSDMPSHGRFNCRNTFSVFICERCGTFLFVGAAFIIFEVVCLVVTCYYVKRIPEINDF